METNGSGSGEECPAAGGPSPLLLLPVLLSLLWVLVDLFYSSSLLGWAVTRLAGVFLRDSAIHLGAVQVSLLTGRVLFKDFHYYCRDFSIRVTDGYAVLRWWKRAGVGACSECALCGHSSPEKKAALVLFQLNGVELHWYKRSEVYDTWEQVPSQEGTSTEESGNDSLLWGLWKELQPSLHFSFKKGRMVFGNHMVERSLIVYCSSAEAHYHTTEASNQYDELMHAVDMCGMEVRVVLEPSAGHCSEDQEEAHHLLKTDTANVIYSWDSPGLVPLGDTSEPKFSWEIELGLNTVINYGCYANRQRHILQKFFFPNDYTERPASCLPQPGEKRIYTSMDVSVRLSSRGAFNIPFHDDKGILHQIGLSLGEGSEVKVHQPWITNQDGYTSVVTGALHNVVVTSDLSYPHLANAAFVELSVDLHFPRVWNATQRWDMRLSGSQVEVGILFSYVDFVNALLDDWVGTEPSDLLHFVPVDWTVDISLSQYEIYLYTTRYNWLDNDNAENSRLAFCGTTGQIRFEFPFMEFLPLEQKVLFTANGQNIVVRHYVPPSSTSREAILALSSANKYRWRVMKTKSTVTSSPSQVAYSKTSSSPAASAHAQASFTMTSGQSEESLQQLLERGLEDTQHFPMGYRRRTRSEDGWVDLACGPSISISILYLSRAHHPNQAVPNSLRIDVDSPTVLLRVFGFLARDLLALKENYPGEYINFTTFHSSMPPEHHTPADPKLPLGREPPPSPPEDVPNIPAERFLDVVVDFALRHITAEFPTYPVPGQPLDAALPSVCTAELAVHVDYTVSDTKVFLHISPFTVHIPAWHPMREGAGSAELGHIAFQGLNFNCHGFTEMMCGERVEYAWLMQLQLHRITGVLSTLQLTEVVNWLQAALQQVLSVGDTLLDAPNGQLIRPQVEPISEDIKYRLFDLAIAEADLHILEGNGILRLQTPGFDLGTCMLHSHSETLGLSLQLYGLTCSVHIPSPDQHCLLRAGELDVGSVQGDITLREPLDCVPERQRAFLRKADKRTRRLWFLWREEGVAGLPGHTVQEFLCGCCGGCQFLDGHIQRPAPKHPSSCAVYVSEPPLPRGHTGTGTMARALGLQSLRRALHSTCIRELDCLQHIHRGLLDFCERRYPPVTEETPTAVQPSISSDSDSFVSALASPEDTESDTNEYYSLENVNEAGLEGHVLPEQPRRKSRKKGSATSAEIADSSSSPHTLLDALAEEDPLLTVLPTHCNQQLTFYVNTKKAPPPVPQGSEGRPEHRRQMSDSEYVLHSKKKAQQQMFLDSASLKPPQHSLATPTSPPGASLQHQPFHRDQHSCLLLRLPLLLPTSPGSLPQVSFSAAGSAKKPKLVKQRELDGPCSDLIVTLTLAGHLSATLSPPMEDLITSMASTLSQHFGQRSALSVLSGNHLVTSLSLNSYLEKLMETQEDSKPFIVHITVGMAPDAVASLQAVQSSPRHYRLKKGGPGMREIVPHASLVTVFLRGLRVKSLIHSESETVPDEMDDVFHLSSFKLSLEGQCAALQVALATILSQSTLSRFPTSSFPHLPPQHSRLDVSLAQHPGLFSLLEASCSNPSITAAAKIVAREVSHKAVLTWEHVCTHPLDSDLTQPSSENVERVKNKLVLSLSLPQLWTDVAAPRTGRADPSTGGLDLLVAVGIVEVWQEKLRRMAETMQGLLKSKTTRDKMVMLALLSNAARSPLSYKVGHPLLSSVCSAMRQCVSYQCLHQLWCTLPAYTDSLLSSIPPSGSCEEEVLAAAVALATRLYSHSSTTSQRKTRHSSPMPIDPATCSSCGPHRPRPPTHPSDTDSESTVGYVSISPSPSELALPNVVFSTQNLDQADFLPFEELYHKVPFSSVVVLRESLLPLLQVVGVPTHPQLRTLCHNKHHLLVDFSAHLKEGLAFVTEPATLSLPQTVPALCLKHVTVSGHLQSNTDNSVQDSPALCLLLGSAVEEGVHQSTTTAVTGSFNAEASSVDVGVTVPLMKLARHLVETSRIRSSQHQRTSKPPKAKVIPVFTAAASLEETDNAERSLPPPMDIWRFARNLVSHLSTLEQAALQRHTAEQGTGEERADSPAAVPSQAVSLSRPSSAGSVQSRSTRLQVSNYSHSPRFPRSMMVAVPASGDHQQHYLSTSLPTPSVITPRSKLTRRPSNISSTSEVAIQIEDVDAPVAMSPGSQEDQVSPLDTSGGDLASSDEVQLSSSSPKATLSAQPSLTPERSTASLPPTWLADTMPLQRTLDTPATQLSHSFFGLLKVDFLKFQLQVETTTTTLRLDGITGSVDTRQLGAQPPPTSSPVKEGDSRPQKALPSYLSVMATVKKTFLGVSDRVLTESEVVRVEGQPIHCSFGLNNSHLLPVATYRCLLKLLGVKATVKQPPVRVHNRLQQLLPTFSQIFHDVFSPSPAEPATPTTPTPATASQPTSEQPHVLTDIQLPSQLPQGYTHFSIARVELIMTPLPSLSIMYTVQPIVAQVETTQKIHYQLSIGSHTLRFNPREHQVALRSLSLPTASLSGDVRASRSNKLPQVRVELAIKHVNIDLTTDILNQLLVLQNSFIKEVNELVQLFINIGESLPQQKQQLESMRREAMAMTGSGVELLSFLDSCQLSLDGICITVSTPLCTAVRFSTSRIDMLIKNSGRELTAPGVVRSQLLLSGRVEINVNLALGYLQDSSEDDDFCELAYFRTKISIRNTQQSAPELSLVGGASENEAGQPLDTFLISIICPHLYIQSSAVEQAILFWLNCKSVYSYWQNQRMQLNKEVREATEEFVAQIQTHRPAQLQTPSLDFSKPRLVQINVTDVGACMPMAPMPHTPHSSQKSFPALVLTIREMSLLVNLSRKVASSGNFAGFCIRFSNQFSLRHKTWTMDSRKNKITNCGIVDQGTFRLCVATRKRYSDTDSTVVVAEKLVWAFQWDMSGIDVNANIDIGHHMSTLVRTATTIGANLEGRKPAHKTRPGPATPPSKPPRKFHKRAFSETGVVEHEQRRDRIEEGMTNLAKETEQVYRLKSSGASRDSLKHEFETLKETEQELRKKVGRMFRKRRGISIQKLTEIFSPTSVGKAQRGILKRRWTFSKTPRRLFSTGDRQPSIPEEEEEMREVDGAQKMPSSAGPTLRPRAQTVGSALPRASMHVRSTSDVTDKQTYQSRLEDERAQSSSPSLTPSATPVPGEEPPLPSPFPPTPISTHDTFRFEAPARAASREPLKAITSIDVEVNVTINVESGIVKLRCLEDTSGKPRNSSPALHSPASRSKFTHFQPGTSPMLHKRLHERTKDSSYDTVILLIPALHVQVHYKSIIGQSYNNIPPSLSSLHLLPTPSTPPVVPGVPQVKVTPGTPVSPQPPPAEREPPVKRGVFSVSFVVASTPEDVTLTPSLLEFVEQVVRPTIAATVSSEPGSSDDSDSTDESDSEEVEDRDTKTAEQTPAISFPVDVTIAFHIQPSTVCLSCLPHSRVQCVVQSPDVSFVVSFSLFSPREVDGPQTSPAPLSVVTFNNLYVTGCLKTFTLQLLSPQVSTLKQKDSDAPKIENKEALSLTLGRALTHLSRKSVLTQRSQMSPPGGLRGSTVHSKLQVSVVTNIASLVLGYDMRRLNDITAFRRYWYRTSLIEAVFIGSKKPQHPPATQEEEEGMGRESSTEPSDMASVDNTISAAIVVAATVDDFRISANVAQVMGNTDLVVTHLKCEAHTDVSHNELVLLRLTGAMERGEVDARGGMVAGSVLMEDVQVQVTTESQQGIIPVHSAQMILQLAEARVDYMSSCILLGRASKLTVFFRDMWEGLQLAGREEEVGEAKIQVLADLSWERVQLAIHRTTTKSMMNIVQKIQDFILQQKRRSERTISIMLPADTKASKALAAYREKEKKAEQKKEAENVDSRHHWLWATRVGSVELMRTLGVPTHVDPHKVSLGGKIALSGQNLCLVCFHGTSFRDNEWAVFNIELLDVHFSTQANPGLGRATVSQPLSEDGQSAQPFRRTCQQTCSLQLAKDSTRTSELATVHRVTAAKGRVPPITGTNLYNWLAYACIDSYLHSECYKNPTTAQTTVLKFSKKLSIQQVLLVPALSVELMNHHFWPVVPTVGLRPLMDSPPLVECSLNSKFAAGISVSTNVDHYLFLHDLVTNYIEYLERHKAPLKSDSSESSEQPKSKEGKQEEPDAPPSREFMCVHWELSPLLNLLSSVSGEFNPHISWLLERLGFKHARTTIPKWVQRGAMDPLDKVVSVAVELLVQLSAKKKLQLRASSPQ